MRRILSVLLFLILVVPIKATAPWTPSDADLQDLYVQHNRDYFGGHLSQNVRVRWANLHKDLDQDQGLTTCDDAHVNCTILLDRETNSTIRVLDMTLLHEMCHIKVPSGSELDTHGPKFQSCMKTLAFEGAFDDLW